MALAKWDVKDIDQAAALAAKLESIGNELNEVSAEMTKQAEAIAEIDGTVEMNVQISNYLKEAGNVLASTIDGVQEAAKQLSSIVSAAQSFQEASAKGQMFK